jgi:catechol 2,3-dioxygenase-like lactoylglutathione lyase family enzyme
VTAPPVRGIIETVLYVTDLARSVEFYTQTMGFERLLSDDRFCALNVGGQQVFLLFLQGGTPEPVRTPGGLIPTHDGSGRIHVGFAVDADTLPAWDARLRERGIVIESRVTWARGGTSIYFRDPDGHLLELVTPGIWAIY